MSSFLIIVTIAVAGLIVYFYVFGKKRSPSAPAQSEEPAAVPPAPAVSFETPVEEEAPSESPSETPEV